MTSNNRKQTPPAWLTYLGYTDKVFATACIFYGLHLYLETGVFTSSDLWTNPAMYVVGGGISLVVSFINLPKRFLMKARNNMVVKR